MVAAVLLSTATVVRLAPRSWSLVACGAVGSGLAIATYVVLATVPLALGSTDVGAAAGATAALLGVTTVLARRRAATPEPRRIATRDEAGILAVAVVAAALNRAPIAYYTMDGDNGVYAVRAVQLWKEGGTTSPAVPALDPATGKTAPLWLPGTHAADEDPWRRQFHALPAWPLVMSLALALGGLEHQFDLQLALYVLVVLIGASLLSDLAGRERAQPLAIVLATSPLLLFFSRYATPELLALALSSIAVRCWSRGGSALPHVAWLPVAALSLTHLSFFLLLPPAALATAYAWARTTDDDARSAALAGLQIAIAQLFALPHARIVSPRYAEDTLRATFGSAEIGLASIVLAAAAIGLAASRRLSGARDGLVARSLSTGAGWIFARSSIAVRLGSVALLVTIVLLGYRLGWTDAFVPRETLRWNSWAARSAYAGKGLSSLLHLSFASAALAGSIVVFAAAFRGLLRPRGSTGAGGSLVGPLFLYALAVFTVARADLPNNYYASRYFLPMLFPLTFAAAAEEARRHRPAFAWSIALAGVLGFNLLHAVCLLRAGFYANGTTPYRWLETRVAPGARLQIVDDPWLVRTFALQSRLLLGAAVEVVPPGHSSGGVGPGALRLSLAPRSEPASDCLRYSEARVPWQILYPTGANRVERGICLSREPRSAPAEKGE